MTLPFPFTTTTPYANRKTVWHNKNLWSAEVHGFTTAPANQTYSNGLPVLRRQYQDPATNIPLSYNPITTSPPKDRNNYAPPGTQSPIWMQWGKTQPREVDERNSYHQLAADVAHKYGCDQVYFRGLVHGTTLNRNTGQIEPDSSGPHFTATFKQPNGTYAATHVYTDNEWDHNTGEIKGGIRGPSKVDAIANPTFDPMDVPEHEVDARFKWY